MEVKNCCVHQIQTLSDLFNLVTLENLDRLSTDLIKALKTYSGAKFEIERILGYPYKLPENWSLQWKEDGEIKCNLVENYEQNFPK